MKVLAVSFALIGLVAAANLELTDAASARSHRRGYHSGSGAQPKLGLGKQTRTGGPSGGSTNGGGG